MDKSFLTNLRIGFVSGQLNVTGSSRSIILPLSAAFTDMGHKVFGVQTSGFKKGLEITDGLDIWYEPLWPYGLRFPKALINAAFRQFTSTSTPMECSGNQYDAYEQLASKGLARSWSRLSLDVVYACHNMNVAQMLAADRSSSQILVINLVGFGIDETIGGTINTYPLQKRIFSNPQWDMHVTTTKYEYDRYFEVYEYLKLDTSKLHYIPYAYDDDVFKPNILIDNKKTGERLLLYPVNVTRRKNIELAIDTFAQLIDQWPAHLVITGRILDPNYYEFLKNRMTVLGIADKVEFLKGVDLDRLADLYRQASITIFTSHRETFGLGIIESLGSGTCVVGPNWIKPCKELLSGNPGGYCAEKTAESYAEVISKVLQKPPHPQFVAQNAKKRYGKMNIASKFIQIVEKIRSDKVRYRTRVDSMDWKELYHR